MIVTRFFVLKTITINHLTVTNDENVFIYFLFVHFDKKFQLFRKCFDFIRKNILTSVNETFVPKTQQTRRNVPKIIILQTNPTNYVQSPGER